MELNESTQNETKQGEAWMLLADFVFAGGSLVWKRSCYGISWTIGKRELNMSRDRSKVSATCVYKHESGTRRSSILSNVSLGGLR